MNFRSPAADFQTIVGIVYERSGIVLAAHKTGHDLLEARPARASARAQDIPRLLRFAERKDGNEVGYLINAITTNLTKFFRESHHFEHLRDMCCALPRRAPRGKAAAHQIWSAGCSSGEEPYSIAITALAHQKERSGDWDLRILASDLDTSMLKKAKTGVYPRAGLESVPSAMRQRFFSTQAGDRRQRFGRLRLSREIITFKQLNLLSPWPMSGKFDAIFCRNVMIYFDAEDQGHAH